MCGITASIALPGGGANGYANGYINGHTNDQNNDHINALSNVHKNGYTDCSPTRNLTAQIQASIDVLNHRGPDESGIWISSDDSVALGHCRLSINDLSPGGRQPLTSDDGQIHAVVNGEIYEHDRLRHVCSEVHGYKFQGESDSELVLALYKIYGAPGFFEYLRGEFAFVLYDSREGSKRIIVCRDRFGIKPLVYIKLGGRVLVAAEAKAFLPMGWKPEWDVGAIVDSGWTFDERTLFKGVKKLLPGHWIEVTEERGIEIHKYWDAEYHDKVGDSVCNGGGCWF
jgi:asparagine synthase (glutamine-hydrolysing)